MKVGVNLLWMVPDVVGGSEEYTTRLLQAVTEVQPKDLELTLFVLPSFVERYPDLADAHRVVVAPIDGASKVRRVTAEASLLAWQARRARVELLHHAGGTIPVLRLSPSVVTIHDLQPLLLPSNFGSTKQTYLRLRLPASARRSRLVITLTEFTRRSIIEHLRVSPERVVLVPPGYTPALIEPPETDPVQAYDLTGPFFVYPAITYPHKNHLVVVRAMQKVVAERPDALLVLSSGEAQMERDIAAEVNALGLGGNVRRIGRVPSGDIDWLLLHAAALVFPSKFEGFGLPVLEAMGHGCPVLAADATALPEVVDGAGTLLDPDDPDAWATAMLDLLRDPSRRDSFAEGGYGRLAAYRWSASAEALLDAYRRGLAEAGA